MPPTFSDEGLQAALAARREVSGLPVLVLSLHVEQLYARELLADERGEVGFQLSTLTERERSVLALMAEGLSNAAIGARLFLSERSISKYTTTIFPKLDIAAPTTPIAGSGLCWPISAQAPEVSRLSDRRAALVVDEAVRQSRPMVRCARSCPS